MIDKRFEEFSVFHKT